MTNIFEFLLTQRQYNLLLDAKGGRGYSCLTKIDDKHIGILYEGSQADLTFQIISIDEIIRQHRGLNYIFKSGTEGYSSFRIPAIITTNSGRICCQIIRWKDPAEYAQLRPNAKITKNKFQ